MPRKVIEVDLTDPDELRYCMTCHVPLEQWQIVFCSLACSSAVNFSFKYRLLCIYCGQIFYKDRSSQVITRKNPCQKSVIKKYCSWDCFTRSKCVYTKNYYNKLLKTGKICEICHYTRAIDACHIVDKKVGGEWSEENILYLCKNCHYLFDNSKLKKEEADIIRRKVIKRLSNKNYNQPKGKIRRSIWQKFLNYWLGDSDDKAA